MFGHNSDIEGILALAVLGALVLLYFLPTIVVLQSRAHNNKAGVIIVNILFGSTIIGWIIALIWACHKSNASYTPAIINQYAAPQPMRPAHDLPRLWRVQLFQGGTLLREVSVGSSPVVIGRSSDADVQINEAGMSGRHWSVVTTPGGVQVSDLGTTNGTWKNGKVRVKSDVATAGDWYQVGQVQLMVG